VANAGVTERVTAVKLARLAVEVDWLACEVTTSTGTLANDLTAHTAWAHFRGAVRDLDAALVENFTELKAA
jgi:hypothetical protein